MNKIIYFDKSKLEIYSSIYRFKKQLNISLPHIGVTIGKELGMRYMYFGMGLTILIYSFQFNIRYES